MNIVSQNRYKPYMGPLVILIVPPAENHAHHAEARDRNVKLDLTNVRTSEDLYQEAVRFSKRKSCFLPTVRSLNNATIAFDALSQRCTIVKVVTLQVDTVYANQFRTKLQNIVDCTMKTFK
ncbi:Hypothetical_protein [Hexamita inflata]|uniref:Hypothetical_protein n=1 Tax=Hexamita inflata TaxID=28002 RepID=A0ABP1M3E8_9EUKA